MKKYRKPLSKIINLEGEPILGFDSANDKKGTSGPVIGGFAKGANGRIIDDEDDF